MEALSQIALDKQKATGMSLETPMPEILCRLCLKYPAIENSHVISKLVFRAIKSDSPTGFFRNPNKPNRRVQDGDKLRLLCPDCEQLFGKSESEFAKTVFLPFHNTDADEFSYGTSLHYYMTSLAWRTLILDLPGLESDAANPRAAIAQLSATAETMRHYLLGASSLAAHLRNHAVVWSKGDSASAQLAAARPNVMIRRSVFGFSIVDQEQGFSAIIHNLAGFMCFLIVNDNPSDNWFGTEVNPKGGEMKQPQQVNSWLMWHLFNYIVESAQKQATMSGAEQQKVRDAMGRNPSSAGLRFRELDQQLLERD
jgi:hypothetical protein